MIAIKPTQVVELEDLFRSSSLERFKEDAFLAKKIQPEEYENSLDNEQMNNLGKVFANNAALVAVLALNILKSFKKNGNIESKKSKHQKVHDYIVASDSWVHNVISFAFLKIRTFKFYYNLRHIFDGDKNGGGHIHKDNVLIIPILENVKNGVIYAEYLKDSSNGLATKNSTFFPRWIKTEKDFMNFMIGCKGISHKNNTELLYSKEDDIYVIRYMRYSQRIISSAFPCLAVFNFHKLDKDKPQIFPEEISTILNNTKEILTRTPAFESKGSVFYDLSNTFKVPGVYLKVKKQ